MWRSAWSSSQTRSLTVFVRTLAIRHSRRLAEGRRLGRLGIRLFAPGRCSNAAAIACVYLLVSRLIEAAGKMAREEGKHDLGSAPDDGFPDNLSIPPAELVANPHSSRSEPSVWAGLQPCRSRHDS